MENRKMEIRMSRCVLVCALMVATAAVLGAQQANPSDSYEGTSNPPPNETITTSMPPTPESAPMPKPSPAHPAYSQAPQPAPMQYRGEAQYQAETQPAPATSMPGSSMLSSPADGTDGGIVEIASDPAPRPGLSQRTPAYDPDGDIVHPAPLGPGQLAAGTTIRVRLLNRLSTTESQDGDIFRSRVASDVLQDGQVLIPAGAEIDGRVMNVSTGSLGGHGSMNLIPETVILPDGSRYRLYAQVTGTPGSPTRVGSEGTINPGSRLKQAGLEYGGAVGAGATTGAILGGPVGALTGSLIGAGVITAHLLMSHPQAHLDEGTALLFTLTNQLNLVAAGVSGN
ncbi:MAG TPA: hypothetical protein VMW15_09190 [Terracidiphilus sp.]|nr:hypothetical protein [Terracidiphilus sp.]